MAVTAHEYVGMLKELLPPGPAWPRGDSTSLYAMMFEVWGTELARIDSRANALIKEADPRFAIETFIRQSPFSQPIRKCLDGKARIGLLNQSTKQAVLYRSSSDVWLQHRDRRVLPIQRNEPCQRCFSCRELAPYLARKCLRRIKQNTSMALGDWRSKGASGLVGRLRA